MVAIVVIAWVWYRATATRRQYRQAVVTRLSRQESRPGILAEKDIQYLPEPVRRYIRYVGLVGKETTHNMKAAGLIPVVNASGTDLASSGLVTLFNDMCLLAPATLIDKRIRWVPVDNLTAIGSIEDNGRAVSATLHFNQDGELTNFVTNDRYMESGGRFQKVTWSTPVSHYRDFNGIWLLSHGASVWHLEEGDFTYAEFDLESIEYNTSSYP